MYYTNDELESMVAAENNDVRVRNLANALLVERRQQDLLPICDDCGAAVIQTQECPECKYYMVHDTVQWVGFVDKEQFVEEVLMRRK